MSSPNSATERGFGARPLPSSGGQHAHRRTRPNLPTAVVSEGKPDNSLNYLVWLLTKPIKFVMWWLLATTNTLFDFNLCASGFQFCFCIFSCSFINTFFNSFWCAINQVFRFFKAKTCNFTNGFND